MLRLNVTGRVVVGLGVVSLLAVVASHLALTDIWHGEGDLTSEWQVLRLSFLVILAFHAAAIATVARMLAVMRRDGNATS